MDLGSALRFPHFLSEWNKPSCTVPIEGDSQSSTYTLAVLPLANGTDSTLGFAPHFPCEAIPKMVCKAMALVCCNSTTGGMQALPLVHGKNCDPSYPAPLDQRLFYRGNGPTVAVQTQQRKPEAQT